MAKTCVRVENKTPDKCDSERPVRVVPFSLTGIRGLKYWRANVSIGGQINEIIGSVFNRSSLTEAFGFERNS